MTRPHHHLEGKTYSHSYTCYKGYEVCPEFLLLLLLFTKVYLLDYHRTPAMRRGK